MLLLNDPLSDTRVEKEVPGAYEWWYFDAISVDQELSFVIIFYDGNPFSSRYIRSLELEKGSKAESFPALSISIYHKSKPVYYSFVEYPPEELRITNHPLNVQIGGQNFLSTIENETLNYHIKINQRLDSGDSLIADLVFSTNLNSNNSALTTQFGEPELRKNGSDEIMLQSTVYGNSRTINTHHNHIWNLIQPRAIVTGQLTLNTSTKSFDGLGYHDHNIGFEPMKESFKEWYWGRFHFDQATLIYYLMFKNDSSQEMKAWLIDSNSKGKSQVLHLDLKNLKSRSSNIFGLSTFNTIHFSHDSFDVVIQQNQSVDNGPFYKRWIGTAIQTNKKGLTEAVTGITEYIRPNKIYDKRYWPLVNMRIRYLSEAPHWVQKSRIFYRWTW